MAPLVGKGLTKTTISKWAKAHSAHLLMTSLKRESLVPYIATCPISCQYPLINYLANRKKLVRMYLSSSDELSESEETPKVKKQRMMKNQTDSVGESSLHPQPHCTPQMCGRTCAGVRKSQGTPQISGFLNIFGQNLTIQPGTSALEAQLARPSTVGSMSNPGLSQQQPITMSYVMNPSVHGPPQAQFLQQIISGRTLMSNLQSNPQQQGESQIFQGIQPETSELEAQLAGPLTSGVMPNPGLSQQLPIRGTIRPANPRQQRESFISQGIQPGTSAVEGQLAFPQTVGSMANPGLSQQQPIKMTIRRAIGTSTLESQLTSPSTIGDMSNPGLSLQTPITIFQGRPTREIWQGELSWKSLKYDSNQIQTTHAACTVSSPLMESSQEPTVSSDNWQKKLIMQMFPKQLLTQLGGFSPNHFQNARSVLFHFNDGPAKDSMTKVFNQGYAGCVHFHSTKDKKCDIRVLILLFNPKAQNYIGYIPNEQIQFIDCFRKIIQENKQRQREVAGSSSMVTTGSPQGQPKQQPQSTSGPMVGRGSMTNNQGQIINSRGMESRGTVTMCARKSMPAGAMQQRQVARIQRIQMQQQTPK